MASGGTLQVLLRSAAGLKDTALFGKQHPYATLSCGEYTVRSRTHQNGGASPVWNEQFFFKVATESSVQIELYSDNALGRDVHIGSAAVPLAKVRVSGREDMQLPALVKGGKQQGTITVLLEFRVPAVPAIPVQPSRQATLGQASTSSQLQSSPTPASMLPIDSLQGHIVINPSQPPHSRRPSAAYSTASSSHDIYMLGANPTPPSPPGSSSTPPFSHAPSLAAASFSSQQLHTTLAEPSFLAVAPRQHSAPTNLGSLAPHGVSYGAHHVQHDSSLGGVGGARSRRPPGLAHSQSLGRGQSLAQQQEQSLQHFVSSLSARALSTPMRSAQQQQQQQQQAAQQMQQQAVVAGLRASLGINDEASEGAQGSGASYPGFSGSLPNQSSYAPLAGYMDEGDATGGTGYDLNRLRALIDQVYPPELPQEPSTASLPSLLSLPSLPFTMSLPSPGASVSGAQLSQRPSESLSDTQLSAQLVQQPSPPPHHDSAADATEAAARPSLPLLSPLQASCQDPQLLLSQQPTHSPLAAPLSAFSLPHTQNVVLPAGSMGLLPPGVLSAQLAQELPQLWQVAPTVAAMMGLAPGHDAAAAPAATASDVAAAVPAESSAGVPDVAASSAAGRPGSSVGASGVRRPGGAKDAPLTAKAAQQAGAVNASSGPSDQGTPCEPPATDTEGVPCPAGTDAAAAVSTASSLCALLGQGGGQHLQASSSGHQEVNPAGPQVTAASVEAIQHRMAALGAELAALQAQCSTGGSAGDAMQPSGVHARGSVGGMDSAAGSRGTGSASASADEAGTSTGTAEAMITVPQHGQAARAGNSAGAAGTPATTAADTSSSHQTAAAVVSASDTVCAALLRGQVLLPEAHAQVLQRQMSERGGLETQIAKLGAELAVERRLRQAAQRQLETLQVECVPVQEYEQLEVVRQQRDGLRAKLEAIERTSAIVPKTFAADFHKQAEMRAAAEREAAALRAHLSSAPDQQLSRFAQLEHERAALSARVAELDRQLTDAGRSRAEAEQVVEELLAERRLTGSLQARVASGGKERELLLLKIKAHEDSLAAAKQSTIDMDAERGRAVTEMGFVRAQAGRERAALVQSIQTLQTLEAQQQGMALDRALLQHELLLSHVRLLEVQGGRGRWQTQQQQQQQ